ncbi:hypothetical protein [Tenacibaculum maritimum]|uniref:hypothetical protein n=1 Tax=Tenacibaculum maritimum TaxID=107401 RepID=UPI00040BA4DE|nr:hypothetical protein [Tenacibaculum maritimum]MDB0599819.1 hypothetical protein [Tenacibaculum maritimum]MDB0610929.1 hypothetical protein [Tenacibaculum maritimum]CAA0245401.1 conserved hypothetical protein [Tenacibaculum maritimum]CAA0259942.1 conserved hypothetical protein [Tenacibaculum maritimum]
MDATKEQIKRIHGLLPSNFKEDKQAKGHLVQQFTNDPKRRSTTTLTYTEANLLIEKLGGTFIPQVNKEWLKFDWKNTKHRKIMSLCREYGWETTVNGKLVADFKRLASWLKSSKSPVKKPITKMNTKELSKVISALENMVCHQFQKKHQ